MPVMDGCQSTKMIREFLYNKGLDQPIICGVTGHTEQQYVNKAIDSGMNQVYSKPLNQKLISKVLVTLGFM